MCGRSRLGAKFCDPVVVEDQYLEGAIDQANGLFPTPVPAYVAELNRSLRALFHHDVAEMKVIVPKAKSVVHLQSIQDLNKEHNSVYLVVLIAFS